MGYWPSRMGQPRILLVDDDASFRFTVRRYLASMGFDVTVAASCAEAQEAVRGSAFDAAVLDFELPDGNALDILKGLGEVEPRVPAMILTGHGTIDLAVRAVKEGAEHFLTKPPDLTALTLTLQRMLEHRRLARKQAVRSGQPGRTPPDPFLGESAAIRTLADRSRRVAAAETPVLVTGPTGSGKSVLARWLHENGPRREEPFVDLNCAGLSRELLESELFGHERGAFTGAHATKLGLLEAAHRGTLFLDEIGDMDPAVQPKLLKAIEEGTFRRLGGLRDRTVDVRLVAATHRDLPALVASGRFREDLYFRINAVPLVVPSLRERREDVAILARWIVRERPSCRGVTLTDSALASLRDYPWPGNVRELRNVLERAAVLTEGGVLDARDLIFDARAAPARAGDAELGLTLEALERRQIERVLEAVGGRVPAAAERLGIPRSTLYQKLKQHGIASRKSGQDV
jgi:DNA-binding NtrC family response regulator